MEKHQLDWISIEGFKSIANSGKIELRPINLVIGANGSGKSNFLETFSLLQAAADFDTLKNYVERNGGANELLHAGINSASTIEVEFSEKQNAKTNICRLTRSVNDGLFLDSGDLLYIQANLSKWRTYRVDDTSSRSPLRSANKTDDTDFLRADGSNLASFLLRLRLTHQSTYQLIVKTTQRVLPYFQDFYPSINKLNADYMKLAWKQKGTDKYFGASALSDGTLRFIFLATLLLQPLELRPSVILIDEPELGLHPKAIGLLAAMIKSASVDTQVIAATQSPILLDYFEPEDILVAERAENGTVFNRLNSADLQTWLEDYSLGQLWEKNYLGANP